MIVKISLTLGEIQEFAQNLHKSGHTLEARIIKTMASHIESLEAEAEARDRNAPAEAKS